MKVGIIGSGGVGQTLAAGFASKGHDVVIGTRDPKASLAKMGKTQMGGPELGAWAKANPKVKVATMAEAARHGEVCVLAVHGEHTAEAVKAAGPDNLAGKLVLDTGNPLEFTANGIHWHKAIPDSCLQVAQRTAPKAKLVKAWNATPASQMVDPKAGPGDQLLCGDDKAAKEQAARILKDFGWNAADIGTADKAPYVEATAIAICNYAINNGQDWGWLIKLPGRRA